MLTDRQAEELAETIGSITGGVARDLRKAEARSEAAIDALIRLVTDLRTDLDTAKAKIATLEARDDRGSKKARKLAARISRPRLVHDAGA